MTITSGEIAGSKLTYLGWKRDTANANAGTIAVTHAKDTAKVRQVSVIDMASNNGLGRVVTAAEYIANITSDTVTTVTNSCGAAVITTPGTISVQTGSATTFTTSGTYTGKADGNVSVACTKAGNLGVTLIDTPGVLVGSGSADTLTTSGTYTGNTSGDIVGTCTLTGEVAVATFDFVFPDGTTVTGWTSGASTVAKTIGQGVAIAATTQAGDDFTAGDTLTITVHGIAELQATFPDGTTGTVTATSATTVATVLGQGVGMAMTSGAGVDVALADTFLIAVQAGTKDLKVIVSVVGA